MRLVFSSSTSVVLSLTCATASWARLFTCVSTSVFFVFAKPKPAFTETFKMQASVVSPPTQELSEPIEDFLVRFEAFATTFKWNDAMKARFFPTLVRDEVSIDVIWNTPVANRSSFSELKMVLLNPTFEQIRGWVYDSPVDKVEANSCEAEFGQPCANKRSDRLDNEANGVNDICDIVISSKCILVRPIQESSGPASVTSEPSSKRSFSGDGDVCSKSGQPERACQRQFSDEKMNFADNQSSWQKAKTEAVEKDGVIDCEDQPTELMTEHLDDEVQATIMVTEEVADEFKSRDGPVVSECSRIKAFKPVDEQLIGTVTSNVLMRELNSSKRVELGWPGPCKMVRELPATLLVKGSRAARARLKQMKRVRSKVPGMKRRPGGQSLFWEGRSGGDWRVTADRVSSCYHRATLRVIVRYHCI